MLENLLLSTDLMMLFYSVILAFVLVMIPAAEAMIRHGGKYAAGNRDRTTEYTIWNKRACRARDNLFENLILFGFLVLIVHVSGNANDISALGAMIFFGGRVVHAVTYLAGITHIRSLAWLAGVIGMIMVGIQVF